MKIGIFAGSIALFFLTVLLGSWYIVDQGERGIVLRAGEIRSISDPGLHFKVPLAEKVVKISVQSQKVSYKTDGYSRDQQPVNINFSVNYRINPLSVGRLYSEYGSEAGMLARLIDPKALREIKIVLGRFNAATAIQERGRLNAEALQATTQAIAADDAGLVTGIDLQIEDIVFSHAYEQSIEQRMLAEVEVERIGQNLEREKIQATIIETQATAEANAIRLRGQAEADAISARGQALRDSPNLVELVQAERWDGVLPTTMLPTGALPVIGVK